MTAEQKVQIGKLRRENCGYAAIAKILCVSVSSVKSYCQRNGLAGNRSTGERTGRCKGCGKTIEQIAGKKRKKFCSAACRQTWWNTHPLEVCRKAVYTFVCVGCGRTFSAYGNKGRKYCSHACYVGDRFGGDGHE